MPHKTFRAVATATTFVVGLAAVWFTGLLPSLETRLADWLVPDSEVTVTPARLVSREESDTEEVYAAVVREMFVGGEARVVITSEVSGEVTCGGRDYPASVLEDLGAEAETARDYCRGKTPRRLSPLPNIAAEQVFLDRQDFAKMFSDRDGDGWQGFYEKYPNSSGYIDFSAVGFNGAGDEALLYASKSCGGLCGEGWYVLLGKGPDGWYIKKKSMLWVS